MARRLNPKQKLFCKYYASDREFFGNGVESYLAAYNLTNTKKDYNNAQVNASVLLLNPMILEEIDKYLESGGLNDSFVDKQLKFLLTQNADLKVKRGAIGEYNKLKARIIKKIDHTTKGDKLPTPIYGGKSTEDDNSDI